MPGACIDYSMSAGIATVLHDVGDGLKLVHRTVVYGTQQLGRCHNKPFNTTSIIIAEVVGKCCPLGDGSLFDVAARITHDMSPCLCSGR